MLETLHLKAVLAVLGAHITELRQHAEDGYTTETVIIIAALAIVAVAATAIIVAKIMQKASVISGL